MHVRTNMSEPFVEEQDGELLERARREAAEAKTTGCGTALRWPAERSRKTGGQPFPQLAFPVSDDTLRPVSTSSQAESVEADSSGADAIPRSTFVTTHWSVVVKAGRSDTTRAHQALSHLCETYWYPLYTYVRKRGYSPEDTQDLTQEFFARLLERKWVAEADQEQGRFRSFLLSAMNHFLADEWDKAAAQKRGGGRKNIPLQLDTAETRYGVEPADPITPEQSYERRWALTLLEQVLKRLQREYEQEGKAQLFAELRFAISADQAAIPYAELADRLGISEAAIRVSVHRLRKEYRQALRGQIAETVTDEAEVAAELAYLREILSR